MISRLRIVSAAAASLMAISVFAQQPATEPVATGAPAITIAPPSCVKPEFPGPFSEQRRFDRFNKDYKNYADCLKKYVADTRAAADANVAAGNAAIKEFNDFNAEMDARQAALKK